ncbi:glycosyltransferase [Zobellella sp. DQSA1]|uniref:glycosyltransferase family 2 protein n=1 Tax=Zobellella sp. DQSA1 TaxID=3342386 RepID=UPI0035C01EF6
MQNLASSEQGKWNVTGTPAYFELLHPQQSWPSGWVLLRGKLNRQGEDVTSRLHIISGSNQDAQPLARLPVTRKNTLLELVYLPADVKRVLLEPISSTGSVATEQFNVKAVNRRELFYLIWRRVLPMLRTVPRQRRRKVSLSLPTLLRDPVYAYQQAKIFREHHTPTTNYHNWFERFVRLDEHDKKQIKKHIQKFRRPPVFHLVITATSVEPILLKETLKSVAAQLFRGVTLWLSLPAELHAEAEHLNLAGVRLCEHMPEVDESNAWLLFLTPGARLPEQALYWFAAEILARPTAGLLYGDHDYITLAGDHIEPEFKPDWSQELLRSINYINYGAVVSAALAARLRQGSRLDAPGYHGLLLAASEQLEDEQIVHIPAVLAHLPLAIKSAAAGTEAPVLEHIRRQHIAADVSLTPRGHYRVRYHLPHTPPKVSIMVPTRDALGHLKPCITSILNKTTYPDYEVLVLDNQSEKPETHAYFAELRQDPRVRVIEYNKPFNYSSINNFAARQATGSVLCLLNNDTEVITPDWLEEMVGQLVQKGVGAVGAKLLYSDGRVQHAGDTFGPGGCAHHLHSLLDGDDPGYCNRAVLTQELSAVTAACLVTHARVFHSLGGLNEKQLVVAFNDVDYCLRVREAGHKVIFTPHAQLFHHESVSRGKDDTPEKQQRAEREVAYMRRRWQHLLHHDPYYNPNLNYSGLPDFTLNRDPLVQRPWEKQA